MALRTGGPTGTRNKAGVLAYWRMCTAALGYAAAYIHMYIWGVGMYRILNLALSFAFVRVIYCQFIWPGQTLLMRYGDTVTDIVRLTCNEKDVSLPSQYNRLTVRTWVLTELGDYSN